MPPKDEDRLLHMRDAAERILKIVKGKDHIAIEFDDALPYALLALFQIIGEAARHVSEELRTQHSEVNWSGWIGFRNRLAHGYFNIDFNIMFDAIEKDLPKLLAQIRPIIQQFRLDFE
jgi:uncharacterized protein with HEPN domain